MVGKEQHPFASPATTCSERQPAQDAQDQAVEGIVEIEPLEMDDDELVWLTISGLPSEREIAVDELLRRQDDGQMDAGEGNAGQLPEEARVPADP